MRVRKLVYWQMSKYSRLDIFRQTPNCDEAIIEKWKSMLLAMVSNACDLSMMGPNGFYSAKSSNCIYSIEFLVRSRTFQVLSYTGLSVKCFHCSSQERQTLSKIMALCWLVNTQVAFITMNMQRREATVLEYFKQLNLNSASI